MTSSARRALIALATAGIATAAILAYALWPTRTRVIGQNPSIPSDAASTAAALASGREADRGAELYVDNCAACHRTSGKGSAGVFPEIAGNSFVLLQDPTPLIRLVLQGSSLPATAAAPSRLGMPGFGWRLSNQEVAQLLTFIRTEWGNRAPGVSASDVGRVRAGLDASAPGS